MKIGIIALLATLAACDQSAAPSAENSDTTSDAVVTTCLDTSLYASYGISCSHMGTMTESGKPVIFCTTGNEQNDVKAATQIGRDLRAKIGTYKDSNGNEGDRINVSAGGYQEALINIDNAKEVPGFNSPHGYYYGIFAFVADTDRVTLTGTCNE